MAEARLNALHKRNRLASIRNAPESRKSAVPALVEDRARGRSVQSHEVGGSTRLLKNYAQVMKMMKKINKSGMRGLGRVMLPF